MPSAVTSPVAVQCAAAKTRSSAAVVDADCLMSAGPSGYQTGSQQSPHAVHEPMPARIESVTQLPGWLSSTLAADGAGGAGALPPWIRALSPEATVAGPALVVEVGADDNSPMRDVPARVTGSGTVLVVAGAAESRTAVLGDLIAAELLRAGVAAVVTDGLIRDSRAVAAAGLPVWARGTTPVASRKDGVGTVGGSVVIGAVPVTDGDLVVADADGVVVWPAAGIDDYLARADEKRLADDKRAAAG